MARPPTTPPTQNGRTEQSTYGNGNGNGNSNSSHHNGGLDHSLLQPRVAVALGVPRRWPPFLIVARLLSIAPALWWGIRSALRFLFTEFVLSGALNNGNGNGNVASAAAAAAAAAALSEEESRLSRAESSLRLTETLLAMVWVRFPPFISFPAPSPLLSLANRSLSLPAVLGISSPSVLLHGLPNVSVADPLHATGDDRAALHAGVRVVVLHVVGGVAVGGVGAGPPGRIPGVAAAAGLDQHRGDPNRVLPDHAAPR